VRRRTRRRAGLGVAALLLAGTAFANADPAAGGRFQDRGRYVNLLEHPAFRLNTDSAGVDQVLGTADDPAPNILGTDARPHVAGDTLGASC